MRGLATALLKIVLSWAVVVAATIAAMSAATGRPPLDALGAGFLAGTLARIAIACLLVAIRSLRERAAVRRATSGTHGLPGRDGPTVLVGHLETDWPLLAPLDGRDCVAYTYQVWRDVRIGRTTSRDVLYEGVGLARSKLVTPMGSVNLLAVPAIEGGAPFDEEGGSARDHFGRYRETTSFTPRTVGKSELAERWSDDDGAYRADIASVVAPPPSLTDCHLEQGIVPRGAPVTIFGHYSCERRGIVPHRDWSRVTRVLLGDPAEASRKLLSRARMQLVLALLLALAASGIGAAFVSDRRVADRETTPVAAAATT